MNARYVELSGRRFDAPQYADTTIDGWVIDQGVVKVEGRYDVRPWSAAQIRRHTSWQARLARWLWDHLPTRTVYKQYSDGEVYTVTRRPFERRLRPLLGADQQVSVSGNHLTTAAHGAVGICCSNGLEGVVCVGNVITDAVERWRIYA